MTFKNTVHNILTKVESDFNNKKEIKSVENDISKKGIDKNDLMPADENKTDLDMLLDKIKEIKDGCFVKEDIDEPKRFNQMLETQYISGGKAGRDFEKPGRASEDTFYSNRRNSIKDEEIFTYIINGIHPDWDYEKPMWRYIRPNGDKLVFVLDGIDKADKQKTYVYIRPVYVKRLEGGKRVIKYGDLEAIPASLMVQIAHDPLNEDVYNNIMRKYSDDPEDWLEDYNATKQRMRDAFDIWYKKNKDDLELDKLDRFDAIRLYQLIVKDGYNPKEALHILKKDIEESVSLQEVEKLDVIRDPKRLKGILLDLGIDPDFVDLPAKIEYEDMGDDTEPPFSFNIVAAPNTSVDNIKELYVRDWDKGGKMFPMDLKTIRDVLSDPINAEPEVDLWDKASTMNKQRRSLNKGTVGKWQELTKDQVIAALREMEQREEFKNIDLVGKYLAPQSFETRNPLVLKALKELDPERAVKPTKTRTGYNGFSYQIFIPDEDYDKTKPPSVKRTNPYRDMMSAW